MDGTLAVTNYEKQRERMDRSAEQLLETVLHRRRWLAVDRDRVAEFLQRLVNSELARLGRGQ